jgi:hypothetical protein
MVNDEKSAVVIHLLFQDRLDIMRDADAPRLSLLQDNASRQWQSRLQEAQVDAL